MTYLTNTCPACGDSFEFLEKEIGRSRNCPHCGMAVTLQPQAVEGKSCDAVAAVEQSDNVAPESKRPLTEGSNTRARVRGSSTERNVPIGSESDSDIDYRTGRSISVRSICAAILLISAWVDRFEVSLLVKGGLFMLAFFAGCLVGFVAGIILNSLAGLVFTPATDYADKRLYQMESVAGALSVACVAIRYISLIACLWYAWVGWPWFLPKLAALAVGALAAKMLDVLIGSGVIVTVVWLRSRY